MQNVTIVDSTSVTPIGLGYETIQLSCFSFPISLHVMKSLPFQLILGTDFIRLSRIVLGISNGCYYFADKSRKHFSFVNKEALLSLQGLTSSQEESLCDLLNSFSDVVTDRLGCSQDTVCELRVTGDPIASKPNRTSPHKRSIIKAHVDKMLKLNFELY
jgi:hypothetical protein